MKTKTKTKKTLLSVTTILLGTLLASNAMANESKKPFTYVPPNTTTLTFERYETPQVVTRERTGQRDHAVFSADSQPINSDVVIYFSIESVSKKGRVERWCCVAQENVDECLGQPVRIRYLPKDEKVELSLFVRPVQLEQAAYLARR